MKSRPPRWALFKWFVIPDRENPEQIYLKRLRVIQTPFWSIYCHWIYLPDTDRDLHNHPWNFTSIILRGGYVEYLDSPREPCDGVAQSFLRWSRHKMWMDEWHKIVSIKPRTITLVITGHRKQTWGFKTAEGFVPWYEYDRGGYGPDPFMEGVDK